MGEKNKLLSRRKYEMNKPLICVIYTSANGIQKDYVLSIDDSH